MQSQDVERPAASSVAAGALTFLAAACLVFALSERARLNSARVLLVEGQQQIAAGEEKVRAVLDFVKSETERAEAEAAVAQRLRESMEEAKRTAADAEAVAEEQRRRTEQARDAAGSLADYILFDLRDALRPLGETTLLEKATDRLEDYLRTFPEGTETLDELRVRMVARLNEFTAILEEDSEAGLPKARALIDECLEISERLVAADSWNDTWLKDRMICLRELNRICAREGDTAAALNAGKEARDIAEKLSTRRPWETEAFADVGASYIDLAASLKQDARPDEAEPAFENAIAIFEWLVETEPTQLDHRRDLWLAIDGLAVLLFDGGHRERAAPFIERSKAEATLLAALDPADRGLQENLAHATRVWGLLLESQDRDAEARDALRASFEIFESLSQPEQGKRQDRLEHADTGHLLGELLFAEGKRDEALAAYQCARAVIARLASGDFRGAGWQRKLADQYLDLAVSLWKGKWEEETIEVWQEVDALRDLAAAAVPDTEEQLRDRARHLLALADLLTRSDRNAEALEAFSRAAVMAESLLALDPENQTHLQIRAIATSGSGTSLSRLGRHEEALQAFQKSRAAFDTIASLDTQSPFWKWSPVTIRCEIGRALISLDRSEEAFAELKLADALATQVFHDDPDGEASQQNYLQSVRMLIYAASKAKDWKLVQGAAARALVHAPRDTGLVRSQWSACWHLGQWEAAAESVSLHLALDPQDAEALQWKTRILSKLQRWSEIASAESALIHTLTQKSELSEEDRHVLEGAYVGLSWASLFTKNFRAGLEATAAGLELDASNLSLQVNRAHALLLLGRTRDAEKIYLGNLGKFMGAQEETHWEQIVLTDIDELEAGGIKHRDFKRVRDRMRAHLQTLTVANR